MAKPQLSNDFIDVILETEKNIEGLFPEGAVTICRLNFSQYAIAYIPRNLYFDLVPNLSYRGTLLGGVPYLLGLMDVELNDAIDVYRLRNSPIDLRGNNTIIGIVDTGIDYRNESFISEDGTSRILNIWDQTVDGDYPNVCFGREYSNEELTAQSADTTDEIGHGTRLAEVAGGRNGVADNCQFLVVKLKQAKESLMELYEVPSNVPAYESSDVMQGVDYILTRASEYSKPVSIIIGLGTNQGGHDGLTLLERYLSQNALKIGIAISVAAGNEALAGHHTTFSFTDSTPYYDVEINVDSNENGFPVWIFNSLNGKTDVAVISPLGETVERIPAVNNFINFYTFNISGTVVKVGYELPSFWGKDQRTTVTLTNPVEGVWRIRVFNNGNSEIIHCWLPITAFVRPETRFLNPNSNTTITTPSTASYVMCVGGFDPNTGNINPTSGRGPSRTGVLLPSFVAPTNSTTSVAAAVNAGASVLLLEWGLSRVNNLNMSSLVILEYIIRSTFRSIGEVYPNNVSGYGKLNIFNAVASI